MNVLLPVWYRELCSLVLRVTELSIPKGRDVGTDEGRFNPEQTRKLLLLLLLLLLTAVELSLGGSTGKTSKETYT
jgi:hypothetical protein